MKLQLPERKRPAPALESQDEAKTPEPENTEAQGDLRGLEKSPKVEEPEEPAKANVTEGNPRGMTNENPRGMTDDTPLGPILTDAITSQPKVHLKGPSTAAKLEISETSQAETPGQSPKSFNPGAALAAGGIAVVGLLFAVFGAAGSGASSGRSGSRQPAGGAPAAQSGGILIE